ncbi:MAG: extracellular solute-binding protein [Ruminococcaceae bacterium]|nr:extracellular solute-binding protein [Oscillospiraceae bacterium]
MKMSKILALVLVALMLVASFAACAPKTPDTTTPSGGDNNQSTVDIFETLKGTYNISMWVSEKDGVAAQFQQQIDAFEALHPGIVINAEIEGVTEADAGSKVVADVATAPDIYCFAQDQLARLVQAQALAKPASSVATAIKANNDKGSVAAATVAGELYAYPMTSDNGYFMYYDTSIISEADAEDLATLIERCNAAGKKFRFALENAWYTASFFFATGCHSNWTMDAEGNFNAIDDNFNSDAGLAAMKGMQMLAQSACYDSNADIFTDAGVIITGIWNAPTAEEHFGANLGATDLPSFTVDGKTYHLGGYTGYKLMGVKPQTDKKKAALLSLLAEYLTGEACQLQRAEAFQWGPSNLVAAQNEVVQSNVSLAAFAKQAANENCVPQGQIHGSWWDIAKVLGADAKNATSEADLVAALNAYDAAIDAVLNMTEDQKQAWSVIGSICGTSWDTDFPLTSVGEGVWESEVLELEAGAEFKVRQGASWEVNFGVGGAPNGGNIIVETTGNYKVRFTFDGTTAVIDLVPAN